MKQDIDSVFHKLAERYYTSVERTYKNRITRARNKAFVIDEIKKEVDFIISFLLSDEKRKELQEIFNMHYNRGESIDWIFQLIKKNFGEIDLTVTVSRLDESTGKEMVFFPTEKDKEFVKLATNEKELLKFFIRNHVYNTYRQRFSMLSATETKESIVKRQAAYNVKWTGKRDNKNEFVQLIYGLHEAGLLNNGKGEITKIVETLDDIFDVKLSDNWQSNHSKSIHKANSDYEPHIFQQIREAYNTYCIEMIDEKRKKSK